MTRFDAAHIPILLLALLPGFFVTDAEAQTKDEVITGIVDQFNRIEGMLPSMRSISVQANHAESNHGIGDVTIWLDPQTRFAKTKNEMRSGNSSEVQEMWMWNDDILFVFERSEWRSDDGSVDVNEMRYYLHQGQVIREMSRRATFQPGQSLDISKTPHDTVDEFELDYAIALGEGHKEKGMALARVAKSLGQRPAGSPPLISLPYRVYLDTISPSGEYAVAMSFHGVSRPDWNQWEQDRYNYYESIGTPGIRTQLVSLWSGAVMGDLDAGTDLDTRSFLWAKWSPSGNAFVCGEDARWYTAIASLYQVQSGRLTKAMDLGAEMSRVAVDAMKQVNHPYVIDTNEALGFINIRSLSDQGRLEAEYRIESKFEGDRNNAYIDMTLNANFGGGNVSVVSATLPDYVPKASTWQQFLAEISQSAMNWLSNPPALEDYLQTSTVCETSGVVYLYNNFGQSLNPTVMEMIIGRPLYAAGPHVRGRIDTYAQNDFGKYDPISVAMINDEVTGALRNPTFVQATQVLYNAKFRSTVHDFQEALRYWQENPAELERQKQGYLQRIANNTLPEGGYYLLENNLAQQLMNQYSPDYDRQLGYLTATRFWLRRYCDGTYDEFALMMQRIIETYDRAYFSQRGLPDLLIDPHGEETDGAPVEVVMTENGALGINEKTPLNLQSLRQQLSGFEVVAGTVSEEGEDYPIFRIMSGGETVLAVSDFGTDDPSAFQARSDNIKMENGISTGDTFGTVFARQYPLGLFVGLETDIGGVITDAPGSERVRLIFRDTSGGNISLSDPYNPPLEELANFELVEIRWQP